MTREPKGSAFQLRGYGRARPRARPAADLLLEGSKAREPKGARVRSKRWLGGRNVPSRRFTRRSSVAVRVVPQVDVCIRPLGFLEPETPEKLGSAQIH